MRCPQCRAENAPDARLCQGCGARLRAAVPVSSEAMETRLQRLIPREYAERLRATRGQLGHERRLVTILFCDVKGSTAMAETLDPEEVLDVMEGAFEFIIAPVYEHEGTLTRLMGDAILALFGAPLAHEDDPERAIRAGLEIVTGAKGYAAKLEKERGIRGFNVRVGINTGQVVVGEVGSDLRAEYTAMGDAVNLAARMEQNAPSGGVLITHAVYRHVRGVFDVQALPPFEVKGKAEPVQAYLVERAKPRAWRLASRGVEGVETRMVGRELELVALQQAYREVVEGGEALAVTVVGEPGVGKSRLLDEFSAWLDLQPEHVWYLRGRAAAEGRAVPYSLWRDLFAARFGIMETDSAADALRKFREGMAGLLEPARADVVGHLAGFDFSASPAVKGLLGSDSFGQLAAAYLVQYLRALVEQQPMPVLLEDLHWADDSSLDLLALAVERLPDAPLLVVGAARPELFERRPHWGEGQEAYGRLALRPLSKRASRALVQEILQKVREVPAVVQKLVVEGAEGNPFYAEELVKMMIEDGAIVPGEEEWRVELERLAQVPVPPTLTAVLQARLDALPRVEKEVLQRASVVGREFWGSLVGELASDAVPVEEVRGLLSALRGRELLYRRERSAFPGTEEYLFKHAVLRDVTYETVLRKLRRRYHAQIAAWLERHAGERLREYLSLIARHYELAGEEEKAAGYLQRSGEELFRVNNYEAARQAFEHALGLLPPLPPGEREPALTGPGAVRKTTINSLSARAGLRYWLGLMYQLLDRYAEAEEQLQQARRLGRQAGDRRIEAQALCRLGQLRWWHAAYAESEKLCRESLALARQSGDKASVALSTRTLGMAFLHNPDAKTEAVDLAEESRALYEEIGDRQGVAFAIALLGVAARCRGEWEQAERHLNDALAMLEHGGRNAADYLCSLSDIAVMRGRLEEARGYAQRARAVAEECGARSEVAGALYTLSLVAARETRLPEARLHLEQAMDVYEQIGRRAIWCQAALGCVLARQGQHDAAWALLVQALRESLPIEGHVATPNVLRAIGQASVHAGRLERGVELLGLALRLMPASQHLELRLEAELDMARAALGAEGLAGTLARGAALDRDRVVADILACETPDAYWGSGVEGAPAGGVELGA